MAVITHADTEQAFEDEVLNSDIPVVVDFWAAWCAPCRMVAPELEELAEVHDGAVKVVKVDVDSNPEVAARYQIFSIPTIGLFDGGELVGVTIGAKPRRSIEAELGLASLVARRSSSNN